jgi:hypothetical protein
VQAVVNSLVIVGLLCITVLMFAVAALLRDVRALQSAVAQAITSPPKQIPLFAAGEVTSRDTFVLVVSVHCTACKDRARFLARAAPDVEERIVLLSPDPSAGTWIEDSKVEVVIDPVLLGSLGADVTPLLLRYAPDGTERWRRPVGSDEELSRLLSGKTVQNAVG